MVGSRPAPVKPAPGFSSLRESRTAWGMSFYADLHVHSHYSRATSPDLDLEHLARWAALKGIGVVASGDCVHPGWRGEIGAKLIPDGSGLFRLRPEIEAEVARTLPPACRHEVRFMLNTEISTIYKKDGRTRKVHHLIFAPDLASVDRLAAKLGAVGNIASDGRPILGLDSRDLLEIALGSGPDCFLIPAHIWTPWFSALGAQSGFESIEACYGDLSPHIFAVETGLSSDPAMNWRVSALDRFRLISSSDAHSAAKLGREATRFLGEPSFGAIRAALERGEGYGGTVEFFPEEGKYHLDGHRACKLCLEPRETLALDGRCPVCGKPLTIGVAHRVELLADRAEAAPPPTAGTVASLVPLPEILAELHGCGPTAQAVGRSYDRLLAALGPELDLLCALPLEEIAAQHPLLGEAMARLRAGTVHREAGYDGEYGTIHLFEEEELATRTSGALLFDAPIRRRARPRRAAAPAPEVPAPEADPAPRPSGRAGVLATLDPDQAAAAAEIDGPLVVLAGPGAGKTRLLTHRLAHLVRDRGVPASSCLAVTFTRRATGELRARLAALLPGAECAVESFHSLGLALLRAHGAALGLPAELRVAEEGERRAALVAALGVSDSRAGRLLRAVSVAKRTGAASTAEEQAARTALERLGRAQGWVDFDDLIALAVTLLERHPDIAAQVRARFRYLCADEFQDIDPLQYRLLTLLAGPGANLCVIGDPDQAIYGFRGADAGCFARFVADYPQARTLRLARNYRSAGAIVAAASALIGRSEAVALRPPGAKPVVHVAAGEAAEAEYVAASIAALMGGHDMLAARADAAKLGFADFAVLYRTDAQAAPLRAALDAAGIPYAKSSPAPIAPHPGVIALLTALAAQPPGALPARLAAAHVAARAAEGADPAALAEARAWLDTLAADRDEAAWRESVALSTEADFHDPRAERVSLLTMHAAKGLEFAVVFVVGLEEGLMPFAFPGSPLEEAARAEERRLLYVAMTRAKERLYLLRARERFRHGERHRQTASSFLATLPSTLTTEDQTPPRPRRTQQYSLF